MSIDAANAVKARLKAIMKADAAEGREALAEHLAFETEMSAEDAIALMNAAPQGSTERSEPEYVPPRRMMSAQDLNRVGFHEKPSGGGKLVANMKRRNGIK